VPKVFLSQVKINKIWLCKTYLLFSVKDAGKTVWYTGIVVLGFLATGALLFAVFKELFWSESPQSVYSDALKKCTDYPRMKDLLGEPITGFCDGSGRRGRTNLRLVLFNNNTCYNSEFNFKILL
jgi:import inner membrane translocase subunit TIM21